MILDSKWKPKGSSKSFSAWIHRRPLMAPCLTLSPPLALNTSLWVCFLAPWPLLLSVLHRPPGSILSSFPPQLGGKLMCCIDYMCVNLIVCSLWLSMFTGEGTKAEVTEEANSRGKVWTQVCLIWGAHLRCKEARILPSGHWRWVVGTLHSKDNL